MRTPLSDAKRKIDDLETRNHRISGDGLLIAKTIQVIFQVDIVCIVYF